MVAWLLLMISVLVPQDEVKEIKLEDALKHKDQRVSVVLVVRSSSLLKDSNICFLNSEKNHRDEKNFSIVVKEEGLKAFAEKKIDDVAQHFRNKKIRVTGKVEEYKGKAQIIVSKFDQVKTLAVEVEKQDPPSEDENKNIRRFEKSEK